MKIIDWNNKSRDNMLTIKATGYHVNLLLYDKETLWLRIQVFSETIKLFECTTYTMSNGREQYKYDLYASFEDVQECIDTVESLIVLKELIS